MKRSCEAEKEAAQPSDYIAPYRLHQNIRGLSALQVSHNSPAKLLIVIGGMLTPQRSKPKREMGAKLRESL